MPRFSNKDIHTEYVQNSESHTNQAFSPRLSCSFHVSGASSVIQRMSLRSMLLYEDELVFEGDRREQRASGSGLGGAHSSSYRSPAVCNTCPPCIRCCGWLLHLGVSQESIVAEVLHLIRVWRMFRCPRVTPNPSFEPTRSGRPLQAFISFWALRVLPPRAAQLKR